MVRRIEGITIELNGDSTNLGKALTAVDTQARRTTRELGQIDRALKLDPGNVTLVAQQQEGLSRAVNNTAERLNVLRQAQVEVQRQFENNEIGAEEYRRFQREVENTESQLRTFQNAIVESQQNQERLSNSTRDLQTLFTATGTSVDDFSDALGTRLTSAIRNGTANADQLNRAIRTIATASLGASGNVDELRKALRNFDGGNIEQVSMELRELSQQADRAEGNVEGLSDSLGGIAGATAGAIGGISLLDGALESASNRTTLEFRLDVDDSTFESAESSVRRLTAIIGDNDEALQATARQYTLFGEASAEANERALAQAGAISRAYDEIDLNQLIQESREIATLFGFSQEEALGLTNALLKIGFPQDQIDIIAEYGTQIERLGFSAEETFGILASASSLDNFNIDNLLDGIKEARIVLTEEGAGFGFSEAFGEVIDVFDEVSGLGDRVGQIAENIANGVPDANEQFVELIGYVNDLDGANRELVGNFIFGTMYEDQGDSLIQAILGAQNAIIDTDTAVQTLNKSLDETEDTPAIQLANAFGQLKTALDPVFQVIGDLASAFGNFAKENANIVAIFVVLGTVAGILTGAFALLTPAIAAIVPGISALLASAGGLAGVFATLTGPIGLIVAGIGLLVTALITAYAQSETFRNGVNAIFGKIRDFVVNVFTTISDFLSARLSLISEYFASNGENYSTIFQTVFGAIQKVVEIAFTLIEDIISGTLTAIGNVIDGALNVILGVVGVFTSAITGDWSALWDNIKTILEGAWTLIKGIVQVALEVTILKYFKTLSSGALDIIKGLAEGLSNRFKGILDGATSIFNSVKDAVIKPIQTARDTISDVIDEIKGFFTGLVLRIPDIKLPRLPRVRVNGEFSLNPPSVPSFEFYANGGIMTRPTVFGRNPNTGATMVGGEAGINKICPLLKKFRSNKAIKFGGKLSA